MVNREYEETSPSCRGAQNQLQMSPVGSSKCLDVEIIHEIDYFLNLTVGRHCRLGDDGQNWLLVSRMEVHDSSLTCKSQIEALQTTDVHILSAGSPGLFIFMQS